MPYDSIMVIDNKVAKWEPGPSFQASKSPPPYDKLELVKKQDCRSAIHNHMRLVIRI